MARVAVLFVDESLIQKVADYLGVEPEIVTPTGDTRTVSSSECHSSPLLPVPVESDPIEDEVGRTPPQKRTNLFVPSLLPTNSSGDDLGRATPPPQELPVGDSWNHQEGEDYDEGDSPVISSPIKAPNRSQTGQFSTANFNRNQSTFDNTGTTGNMSPPAKPPTMNALMSPVQGHGYSSHGSESLESYAPADNWPQPLRLYLACESFWFCIFVAKEKGYGVDVNPVMLARAERDITSFYNSITPQYTPNFQQAVSLKNVFAALKSLGSTRSLYGIQKFGEHVGFDAIIPYLHYIAACKRMLIEPKLIPKCRRA